MTFFGSLLFFFIASFFLTLGSDEAHLLFLRQAYGALLLGGFFLVFRGELTPLFLKSLAIRFFLFFLIFQLVRLGAVFFSRNPALSLAYLNSPVVWFFYFGFFVLGFLYFRVRKRVERLLWSLSWCGFLLALNALPALLTIGRPEYLGPDGFRGFFYPAFYSFSFFSKYLLGRFANLNYTGDVVALGFFPATGLFLYSLHRLRERKIALTSLGLPATFAGATALAVILFFSRGTILSFSIAFMIYILATLLKFPSRHQLIFSSVILGLVSIFLIWAGNLPGVWKELGTLRRETHPEDLTSSFATNREGAHRALAIYRDYPLWGVGTDGYAIVSKKYTSSIPRPAPLLLADIRAMCHYLQLLAEEGMGAYLYFFFLLAYFFEGIRGLRRTKSRFQFTAGLSLFAAVVMVLIHASINLLMEQFSISMLIYIFMGASLGVLRNDFERD